jgi:hypothetical protein
MKYPLPFIIVAILFTNVIFCQEITNSFEEEYKKRNQNLNYKYDSKNNVHDYSGNWDFDGDGKKDKLRFIGTSGAHLYYYLEIKLSSTNMKTKLPLVETDFPLLVNQIELQIPGSFAIKDLTNDGFSDLLILLDEQTLTNNTSVLKKMHITSNLFSISFEKGKINFKDFINGSR